jgi:hypothetical protein
MVSASQWCNIRWIWRSRLNISSNFLLILVVFIIMFASHWFIVVGNDHHWLSHQVLVDHIYTTFLWSHQVHNVTLLLWLFRFGVDGSPGFTYQFFRFLQFDTNNQTTVHKWLTFPQSVSFNQSIHLLVLHWLSIFIHWLHIEHVHHRLRQENDNFQRHASYSKINSNLV